MLKHMISLFILTAILLTVGCSGIQITQAPKTPEMLKAPCNSSAVGCPDVVWITVKEDSFMMGSNSGDDYRKPVHLVSMSAFRIAESEVTVHQYQKCVEAGVCTEPHWDDDSCYVLNSRSWRKGRLPDSFRGAHLPITCVDWGQARTFSQWVGGDLPTETQWEYAASGGQRFKYSGSDDASAVGWHRSNSDWSTHPVKRKQRNGYGLYDMSGNVSEWILDEWHDSYSGAPSNGDEPWGLTPACNIKCDRGSSKRMSRGGNWRSSAGGLSVVKRAGISPDFISNLFGFRPVMPVQ